VIEPARFRDHSERMLQAFGADLAIAADSGRHVTVHPGAQLHGRPVVCPETSARRPLLVGAARINPRRRDQRWRTFGL